MSPEPYRLRLVRLGEDDGRPVLLVDGVVQSVLDEEAALAGYWAAMLPPSQPRSALLLGLGAGTLAALLRRRHGARLAMVGVEDDPAVIATAERAGWLPRPGLRVVQGDAFDNVASVQARFEYVAVDLYRGDELAGRVLTRPFLRRLREILIPSGWLAVNLFQDRRTARRVERLARVFAIREQRAVGTNLVVLAQAPRV